MIIFPSETTYSVQAYGIHADFSLGARVFVEIEEALAGYEIGILGTLKVKLGSQNFDFGISFKSGIEFSFLPSSIQ